MGTIAAGSVLAELAPSPVWAVEPKTLTQADGGDPEALLRLNRKSFSQLAWLGPRSTSGS